MIFMRINIYTFKHSYREHNKLIHVRLNKFPGLNILLIQNNISLIQNKSSISQYLSFFKM